MLFNTLNDAVKRLSFQPPDTDTLPGRRADLDWLRIGLFGLLIIHHVGMYYVLNWGWHAKSDYRAEWLESVLLIVEPWRMPAIWLVSGIAIRFILAKVSLKRFVLLRSYRLLLPLLFGVLVVVPPQLYVEMSAKGEIAMSYWEFLHAFFQTDHPIFTDYYWGIWPHVDVNHLWYLRSLWYYSMVLIPLLPLLNSSPMLRFRSWLFARHGAISLGTLLLPILLLQIFWKVNDIRYPIGFLCLVYGYLLGWYPPVWQKLKNNSNRLLITYAVISAAFITLYNQFWLDVIKGGEIGPAAHIMVLLSYSSARILGLSLVLAIAVRFFNHRNRALGYFSDAVYPFYILHQSIILVVGYQLTQLQLGPVLEPALVLVLTIALCFGFFEVIRRSDLLRPFFGLSIQRNYSLPVRQLGYITSSVMLAPLLWQLVF